MSQYENHLLDLATTYYRVFEGDQIPKDPEFAELFSSDDAWIDMRCTGFGDDDQELFIPKKWIPLLAAIQLGLPEDFLIDIAGHHRVYDSAESLITGLSEGPDAIPTPSGMIPTFEVLKRCVTAVEAVDENSLTRAYLQSDETECQITVAMLHSKSPKQWPSAKLKNYERIFEGVPHLTISEFHTAKHNFFYGLKDAQVPMDENGPRYDWLIERAGMLRPRVVNKSLGHFMMWEDLIYNMIHSGEDSDLSGFLDYLKYDAPEKYRAPVIAALQSMMLNQHFSEGAVMIQGIETGFYGTWLAGVTNSIVLQINMIDPGENATSFIQLAPGAYPALVHNQETLISRLYQEVAQVPAGNLTLAHFAASAYPARPDVELPKQIDTDFDREGILIHLITGLDAFKGDSGVLDEGQADIQDIAVNGVAGAARALSDLGELDYSRFANLSSIGARALALGGLDIKKLPTMSNRDKGRVLSTGLGL